MKQQEKILEDFKNKFKTDNFDLSEIKKTLKLWYESEDNENENSDLKRGFHKLIQKAFRKLSIEEYDRNFIAFQIRMNSFLHKNKKEKLQEEFIYSQRKIKKLKTELQQIDKINFVSSNSIFLERLKNKQNFLQKNLEFHLKKEKYLKKLKFIK